jgi:MHS family proline/betaine transporter-like MFS transporter
VLASFGVSILSHFNFLEQGWRLLYLIGCITAFFAFFLRRQASLPTVKTTPFSWRTTWNYLVEWRQTLFLIASAAGFYYATATMAFIFINGFAPLVCRVTATEMARMNTYLLMIDCLSLPLFGFVASFVPRVRLMRWASTCAIIFGMPLFMLLDNGSLWNVVIVRAFLMIIGVWFSATFYSWSQNLAPKTHRYTLISLGYTLGSQLLGAPAAAISLWLFQSTQWTFSASWYWILLALIVNFWTLVPKQQLKIAPQN